MEYSSLPLNDLEATFPVDSAEENRRFSSESEAPPADTGARSAFFSRASAAVRRYSSEILGGLTIILLTINLSSRPQDPCIRKADTGFKAETPEFSSHLVMFMNDSRYANAEMWHSRDKLHEVLVNWAKMAPKGHGLVSIPNPKEFNLDAPMMMNPTGKGVIEPVYQISFFHALHCLSNILRSHAQLHQGGKDSISTSHTAHCFDYLRQSLMCTAHTKLEGDTESKGYVKPWGINHVCVNYQEVVNWADKMSPWEFPDDSTL